MKSKHFSMKSVISMLLALVIIAGTLPVSVFAAQSNEYVDPADNWLSSNNRTNELDVNATITNETQYCNVCKKHTSDLHTVFPNIQKREKQRLIVEYDIRTEPVLTAFQKETLIAVLRV